MNDTAVTGRLSGGTVRRGAQQSRLYGCRDETLRSRCCKCDRRRTLKALTIVVGLAKGLRTDERKELLFAGILSGHHVGTTRAS